MNALDLGQTRQRNPGVTGKLMSYASDRFWISDERSTMQQKFNNANRISFAGFPKLNQSYMTEHLDKSN